jgi:hypothetical protein
MHLLIARSKNVVIYSREKNKVRQINLEMFNSTDQKPCRVFNGALNFCSFSEYDSSRNVADLCLEVPCLCLDSSVAYSE